LYDQPFLKHAFFVTSLRHCCNLDRVCRSVDVFSQNKYAMPSSPNYEKSNSKNIIIKNNNWIIQKACLNKPTNITGSSLTPPLTNSNHTTGWKNIQAPRSQIIIHLKYKKINKNKKYLCQKKIAYQTNWVVTITLNQT